MSTAKKTARVGNCSRMDHLLSRLADAGGEGVAGLLNDLKQHAEQLEKKIRQLEKEAEKYKVSALCCGPIITAAHPDSSCSAALQGHDHGEAAAHEPKEAGDGAGSSPQLHAGEAVHNEHQGGQSGRAWRNGAVREHGTLGCEFGEPVSFLCIEGPA